MISDNPRSKTSIRKLIYILLICVLIVPLFWLSQPASTDAKGVQRGGLLANYRENHHLSQSDLGQIDPTSETIRLATLGMRGPACALLWLQSQEYQKKKDWTQVRATVDQISLLQPHSLNVWKFQAWNLSYNVSVSFDDYHDKYYWVVEGIKYLLKGVKLNPSEPRLAWDMGWFLSNKIGRADESKQYRRLFRADDNLRQIVLPADVPLDNFDTTDNWHVGKAWFLSAENRINERHPVTNEAEPIFYSNAPLCQFYYSEYLEKDGHFGDLAFYAWRRSEKEWHDLGERAFPEPDGKPIQMNRLEDMEREIKKVADEIDAVAPGVRKKLEEEQIARLPADKRKAVRTAADKRTEPQMEIVALLESERRLKVSNEAIVNNAYPADKKAEGKRRARYAEECAKQIILIQRERSMVNFVFWRLRAQAEQMEEALGAREKGYLADDCLSNGDLNKAEDLYDKSMKQWRVVLDRYPALTEDASLGGDLLDMIHRYERCRQQRGKKPLPEPFVLQDIVKRHERH